MPEHVERVAPDGWIRDPDSDGVTCGNCASPAETVDWMAQREEVERLNPLGDDDE